MSATIGRATWSTRPTIIEVAARAQVSKSLASRALRSEPGVAEEKRKRVLEAAAELGYRINSAARSLVSHESGLIGVVLNDIGNPHHAQIVAGVDAEARARGLRTLITHGAQHAEELVHQSNTLLEMQVDGLIVVSSWMPRTALRTVGTELPTVVVAHLEDPPDEVDLIASDDAVGSAMAAEHLLEQQRTRLAYFTRSTSATSHARWRGIHAAAERAGATAELVCFTADDDVEVVEGLAVGRWDGAIANNDLTAAEVLRRCHEAAVRVPEELALVGYDNTSLSRVLHPSLTSVDQPQIEMGRRAVEQLQIRRTQPDAEAVRAYYRPELVVRQSSVAGASASLTQE